MASSGHHRPSRIAIVGSVGVPAKYGGFETLAEQLCRHVDPIVARLLVTCAKTSYPPDERSQLFHLHERHFLRFKANGWQSMVHDAWAILYMAMAGRCDGILLLGVSGAWILPLLRLIRPSFPIWVNIDGAEALRTKWGKVTSLLLRTLEALAIRHSTRIIADNAEISGDLLRHYDVNPVVIAYGGDHIGYIECLHRTVPPDASRCFALSRIVPENNVEAILAAFVGAPTTLVYVGNWDASRYGADLQRRYAHYPNITLHPPIYDQDQLNRLRGSCSIYVHGHGVGGTNPSLVEAIFWASQIYAFDCKYNRSTMQGSGEYWSTSGELRTLLTALSAPGGATTDPAIALLRARYAWTEIAAQYIALWQAR